MTCVQVSMSRRQCSPTRSDRLQGAFTIPHDLVQCRISVQHTHFACARIFVEGQHVHLCQHGTLEVRTCISNFHAGHRRRVHNTRQCLPDIRRYGINMRHNSFLCTTQNGVRGEEEGTVPCCLTAMRCSRRTSGRYLQRVQSYIR
jgi:hypothetical protein